MLARKTNSDNEEIIADADVVINVITKKKFIEKLKDGCNRPSIK